MWEALNWKPWYQSMTGIAWINRQLLNMEDGLLFLAIMQLQLLHFQTNLVHLHFEYHSLQVMYGGVGYLVN